MAIQLLYDSKENIPAEYINIAKQVPGEDEKYIVSVVNNSEFQKLREKNTLLAKELEAMRPLVTSIKDAYGEDFEISEITDIKRQNEDLTKKLEEIGENDPKKVEALVSSRTEQMKNGFEKQLKEKATLLQKAEREKQKLNEKLNISIIANAVSQIVSKEELGIHPAAITDITRRAQEVFSVSDTGGLVPEAEGQILRGIDGSTPMTIAEWIDDLKDDAPHYFKKSSGGGAAGGDHIIHGDLQDGEWDKLSSLAKLQYANSKVAKRR